MGDTDAATPAIEYLLTPQAVRERAHILFRLAARNALPHFRYNASRLPAAVDYVLDTIRSRYPDLAIPPHSRWRHFRAGGIDRWELLSRELAAGERAERARVRFDLAVTSVLLDAGSGAAWRYEEPCGASYARSEGLAVASFHLFRAGLFSADPAMPWRADAEALISLEIGALSDGLQVSRANPLPGLEGRLALLQGLGRALEARRDLFGSPARFGNLFDSVARRSRDGAISASRLLRDLLHALSEIWPGRHRLGGVCLGDVWRHSAISADGASDSYVPFHKLSQWLTYSLVEPIEDAGLTVRDLESLTGLAEYRNGGLMIDIGLLEPRDPGLHRHPLPVEAEPIVEWRALTIALLDHLAESLRRKLGLSATALSLPAVLEGGTWAAGRRLAKAMRADGGPPLRIDSDGTVF